MRSETRKRTSPDHAVIMIVSSQPQAVRINFSCLEATQPVVFCYINADRLEQTLITSSQSQFAHLLISISIILIC